MATADKVVAAADWAGNYSRFTYDRSKNYFMVLKEKEVPWLDDECNASQEIQLSLTRNIVSSLIGDGSPDDGMKIVGTGAANNFTIKAGKFMIGGWFFTLESDTTYSAQPYYSIAGLSALTTPGSSRTDEVYLDVWYDEVDNVEDSTIVDPTMGFRTSCRLQIRWAVKVAEGATTPASADVSGKYHWRLKIATIVRTTSANIDAGMVTDNRVALISSSSIKFSPTKTNNIANTNVQGALESIDTMYKKAVLYATTAALPTCTYNSTTKRLTASANAAIGNLDGTSSTPVANDRILVKDQADQKQNGIYYLVDAGSAGTPWIMQRSKDFDEQMDVFSGACIYVVAGTTNAKKLYYLSTINPVLDTSNLVFDVQNVQVQYTGGYVDWANIINKPATFPHDAHTHAATRKMGEIRFSLSSTDYDSNTELPIIGTELDITSYQALYDWAVAKSLVTTYTNWQAGWWGKFCDTTTGKFRIPDFRGEHIRVLDQSRNVDPGRAIGQWQADEYKSHYHNVLICDSPPYNIVTYGSTANPCYWAFQTWHTTAYSGGAETRGRNVPVYAYLTYALPSTS